VNATVMGNQVRFLRERDAALEAAYDVTFADGVAPNLSLPSEPALSPEEMAQFRARALALRNIEKPCSDRYNVVTLREPGSSHWLAWALTISSDPDPDLVLIGGQYRFTISDDGQTILQRDALSLGCARVNWPWSRSDQHAAVPWVTQLVSDKP